jgi:hypothetical protein
LPPDEQNSVRRIERTGANADSDSGIKAAGDAIKIGSHGSSSIPKRRRMEPWYRVTRSDWIVQDHFQKRWIRAGEPRAAALFGRIDVRASEKTFYFNPEAARLAPDLVELYRAMACKQPDISNLALLVGDKAVVERKFV